MVERAFNQVKLFSGILYTRESDAREAIDALENRLSAVDMETEPIPFIFTDYYTSELGECIFRKFISFSDLVTPECLPDLKLWTNRYEAKTSVEGKRIVNLDPGYLSEANVIIATAKNHYHRVPLSKGIYAHIEYTVKHKNFDFLEWTYPDFKSPEYLAFFRELKLRFKQNRSEV